MNDHGAPDHTALIVRERYLMVHVIQFCRAGCVRLDRALGVAGDPNTYYAGAASGGGIRVAGGRIWLLLHCAGLARNNSLYACALGTMSPTMRRSMTR